jgi:four helix bundle protein
LLTGNPVAAVKIKEMKLMINHENDILMMKEAFRNLAIWQNGRYLLLTIFSVTDAFLKTGIEGSRDLIRNNSAAFLVNILKAFYSRTSFDFIHHMRQALRHIVEVNKHIKKAYRFELLSTAEYELIKRELSDMKRQVNVLVSKVRASKNIGLIVREEKNDGGPEIGFTDPKCHAAGFWFNPNAVKFNRASHSRHTRSSGELCCFAER